MKQYYCLIVEDEPIARNLLKNFIIEDNRLTLMGTCISAEEALPLFAADTKVDILFLDINLGAVSGIDLLSMLPYRPNIIFTTDYREFALDGYEHDIVDYLLKPFTQLRFIQAANKAIVRKNQEIGAESAPVSMLSGSFFIRANGADVRVWFSEIWYIEGFQEYVKIVGRDFSYITYTRLKTLLERLPSDEFHQVHRSYIVNLSNVRIIKDREIWFEKKQVPISLGYKDTFYEKLTAL